MTSHPLCSKDRGVSISRKTIYSLVMFDPVSHVFTIPVEGLSSEAVLRAVEETKQPLWIVTLNPEMLVASVRDASYARTLQQADIRTIDGFGLWALLRFRGLHVPRVPGVELAAQLLLLAQERGWKVGCFGGHPGTGEALRQTLMTRYPGLSLLVEEAGRIDQGGGADEASEEALHRLTLFGPDILLVALGGGTKQESWIAKRIQHIPQLRVAIGVGGTFDYWTGRIRRAPRWMQRIGFEWLWRLCMEPTRIRRIWNALVVFPWLVLRGK